MAESEGGMKAKPWMKIEMVPGSKGRDYVLIIDRRGKWSWLERWALRNRHRLTVWRRAA
jgi:hypothetical protein